MPIANAPLGRNRAGRSHDGWQRRTLPPGCPSSTIRAAGLNFRVRDGIGCDPCALATSQKIQSEGRKRLSVLEIAEKDAGQASRAISTAQLHVSPRFHLPPINVLVSHGPSETNGLGVLILGGASHLDAFSGYPFPTSLPGNAPGGTTGTRVVSPLRSSRTRSSSPQYSNAHDGYRPNCLTTF